MKSIGRFFENLGSKGRATILGFIVLTLLTNAIYTLPQALNFFLIVGVFVLVHYSDAVRYSREYVDEYETELIEEEQEPVRKVSKKK